MNIAVWSADTTFSKTVTQVAFDLFKTNTKVFFKPFDYSLQKNGENFQIIVLDITLYNGSLSAFFSGMLNIPKLENIQFIVLADFLNQDILKFDSSIIASVNFIDKRYTPEQLKVTMYQAAARIQSGKTASSNANSISGNGSFIKTSSISNVDKLALQLVNQITENIQFKVHAAKTISNSEPTDFDTLINALPSPIYIKDAGGRYVKVNKAFEDLLGVSNNEIRFKTIYDLVSINQANQYHDLDQNSIASGTATIVEEMLQLSDESKQMIVIRNPVKLSPQDEKFGIVGLMLDVTEMQQAEKYLEIQRDLEYNAWLQGGLMNSIKYIMDKIHAFNWIDGGGIYLFNEDKTTLQLVHAKGLDTSFLSQVNTYDSKSKHVQFILQGKL